MNRNLLLAICVGGVLLVPSAAGARERGGPAGTAPTIQVRGKHVVDLNTRKAKADTQPGKRTWSARFARFRSRVRQAPRRLVRGVKSRLQALRARRQLKRSPACSGGACSPATASVRTRAGVRLVARVRPLSRSVYIKRSRAVLKGLRARDKVSAFRVLASRRVRRSPAAQHAVLNYLRLRGMKGGRSLPMTMANLRAMVGRNGWNQRRMANFALVLQQASFIARRERIGAKQAFDKALKINGIYNRYYNSRCGA